LSCYRPKLTVGVVLFSLALALCFSSAAEAGADLSGNGIVDLPDLAILASYWMETNCAAVNDCNGADSEPDGDVDWDDLEEIAWQWLADVNDLVEMELTFVSIGSEDGRVYDQNDGIGAGYTNNDSGATALRVGDYSDKKGFRTILSFDTSLLPDDAEVIEASVEMVRGEKWGEDPFGWAGRCIIDVNSPCIGTSTALEFCDWEAPVAAVNVAEFLGDQNEGNPMISTNFDANGLDNINIDGTTQLRVYFTTSTNSDANMDFLGFYGGEVADQNNVPTLTVRYLTSRMQAMIISSTGALDGRVYDENNSGVGAGSTASDSGATALRLGDYSTNTLGFRTILSFNTSLLPDDCTITSAKVQMVRGEKWGEDQFEWAGKCLIDINSPALGTSTALENYDWEAPAGDVNVATFLADPNEGNPMISTYFDANGLDAISKTDTTQLRVYFTTSTNGDPNMDFLGFYGGEATDPNKHPKLMLEYEIAVP